MTTPTIVPTSARIIADKAYDLCMTYFGSRFKTYRRTPMLRVMPNDLPLLGIYILRERRETAQANQSMPKFNHIMTLGISGGVNMENDRQNDIHELELMMDEIDELLLCESKFIRLTEGIAGMDRIGQYAKVGETTLFEIRVEMSIAFSSYWPPRVFDDLRSIKVTTQFPDAQHVEDGTPQITRVYDLDQN